ncbi:MAG TPA: hypothetical protein VM077_00240 [Candidatus Limnocylindrales bacterium]|nr:hypothetical protein [Candidatus Limnocylindrales bacterium]
MAITAKSFSKKEAISFGWEATKKNFWFLLGMLLVTCLIQFIPNILSGYLKDQFMISILVNVVVYIVSLGLYLGAIKIYLSFVDGKKSQFSDLYSLFKVKLITRYFLASLMYSIVLIVAFVPVTLLLLNYEQMSKMSLFPVYTIITLLIAVISGFVSIYLITRLSFYPYFIVDKKSGIVESLINSWRVTKGHVGNIIFLELLFGLLIIAGALALIVGLLVAMPVVSLAGAFVYRKLSPPSKAD